MSNPNRKLDNDTSMELRRLTFVENFGGTKVEVTVPPASELAVRHGFRTGKSPTKYLVVRQEGNGILRKGTTEWDENFAYLQNVSSTSNLTATVIFLP